MKYLYELLVYQIIFIFNKKWCISDIYIWNFNETLANDVGSFEQLGPGRLINLLNH